ncbi:hypothetical protein RE628_20230 [Paenibacillus sp. D2_2]|uniref:hypothetical protein n=1 Tax=Paenibacillus sp. D2_2 TaxID=3073092 RepID=UPI0028155F0C|nr:hypothetical protein [Paenibacillus sp. D2_2]WMT39704.1 hypothetical protein RE628_20230 [Paenibacillus sp. D2_2]
MGNVGFRHFRTGVGRFDGPANWTRSNQSDVNLYIEGNAVAGPDGQVWDVLRRSIINRAGIYKLGADNKTFTKYGEFDMPGGDVKFTIRYDSVSGKYIALVNEHTDYNVTQNNQRNVLSLMYSTDLVHWMRGKLLIQDDENLNWELLSRKSVSNTSIGSSTVTT